MGLTFLQPAFLWGILAAGAPILIHLINRQRALVHRFPAVRFLLLADKRTARKFRVRQWLLLALRVLALLFLAFLLAQPRLTSDKANAALALPPQATVILVDNSLSMQYRDGQESRLQRAKAMASRLLQGLAPQDSAIVLPLLTAAEAEGTRRFSQERETLQAHLQAIEPSHAAVDLAAVLPQAFKLLQESGIARRRLVVLSDLTVHGWADFHVSQLPIVLKEVTLHFIRLGRPERDANVVVTNVRITEKPFIEHTPLEVTAWVRNLSAETQRNLRVELHLGTETVGEQLADLAPDEQVAVPFRIAAPPAGLHWGDVRLAGDAFAEDDRFIYALRTVAPAHVLVVDGDPGTSLFDSETFYLLSALQPRGVLGQALFYPKPVTWEGLDQERFSDYQIIVLCNVEALPQQVRQRLHQFVLAGGGLVFFAGNRMDATRYNAAFYRSDTLLLPLALGQPIQQPQEQPMTLGHVGTTHDALSIFADMPTMLQRGQFYRYFSVQGLATTPGVRTMLTLQDGHPLLVEKALGRGRVLFFTSSADRDWTDLPTRTAYVPLLHGIVGYAAQLSAATQRPAVFLPASFQLLGRAEDADAMVTIRTPDSHEYATRYAASAEGVVATVTAYTIPGIYQLTTPLGADLLAVNATRAESNFTKLTQTELQARLQPMPMVLEEEEDFGQASATTALPIRELAGAVLLLLAAVLMVENVCANRF